MTTDFLWPHLTALPYFRGFLRAIEARLLEGVELPAPRLDVGCGDGHFGQVALRGPTDVGIDPAIESLREAKGRAAYRWLLAAQGASLPLADRSMGSVVSNSVLEHIPDVRAVLREIGRVLRPGGRLVFTVPNPGYLLHLGVPAWLEKARLGALGERYRRWFRSVTRVRAPGLGGGVARMVAGGRPGGGSHVALLPSGRFADSRGGSLLRLAVSPGKETDGPLDPGPDPLEPVGHGAGRATVL